jgi:hypothetical protein
MKIIAKTTFLTGETTLFHSRERKCKEIMVEEEYCWAMTQVERESSCGRQVSRALKLAFQMYCS